MTDKQPEALAQMLQPGGIVPIDVETTAMLVGEITRQHAAIERKDALLRQALEQMGQFSAIDICETQHHKKADQHSPIAQCPVAERFRAVWFAITSELAK